MRTGIARREASCACVVLVNLLFDGKEGNMAGYCTSVRQYFHEP